MELCLGTVQFGMKYGIANTVGQLSPEQSIYMLENAVSKGITTIDTANGYGTAEKVVGDFLRNNKKNLRIITKLKPNIFEGVYRNPENMMRQELEASLSNLGLECVDGFLLHNPKYIYKNDILEALISIKKSGLIKNIGISIYEIEDGFAAVESGAIDYIQLPFSIFDQRAYHSGLLQNSKERGVTVFARSVFLQGLALMPEEKTKNRMTPFLPYLKNFKTLTQKYCLDDAGALIAFVREISGIGYLVFGAETIPQMNEVIEKFESYTIPRAFIEEVMSVFKDVDRNVILPNLWTKNP